MSRRYGVDGSGWTWARLLLTMSFGLLVLCNSGIFMATTFTIYSQLPGNVKVLELLIIIGRGEVGSFSVGRKHHSLIYIHGDYCIEILPQQYYVGFGTPAITPLHLTCNIR